MPMTSRVATLSKARAENLNRGLIVVYDSAKACDVVSWRSLSEDSSGTSFNVYADGKRLTPEPIATTCYVNTSGAEVQKYKVIPCRNGVEQEKGSAEYVLPALFRKSPGYLSVPLDAPDPGVIDRTGERYAYHANDASVGDVDGDGEYEIFLKWEPSNAKDNSHSGYTGNVFIDCYKLDGTKLWRVDLGRNIRAGAHYTPFMVADLDADGCAEMVVKTAPGTVDGAGVAIGDTLADYRNEAGRILSGPEYVSVFSGKTGKVLYTTDYLPSRFPMDSWGKDSKGRPDTWGNRCDRFLGCIAWLDGRKPSVVMCRGYYDRSVLVAWDWDGSQLKKRWLFDSKDGQDSYSGQGNHNLRVQDVDGDGFHEIIYGSMTLDQDGTGLYSTGMGHGDALHATVFDPATGKMGVWACHENRRDGSSFREAATGKVVWQIRSRDDVGRCMAGDIDPRYRGWEMWSSRSGGIRSSEGEVINPSTASVSMNMGIWWDKDLLRELSDGTVITKYDYMRGKSGLLLSANGCSGNNGSKNNPCLIADIIGDWREEWIVRSSDDKELRIYTAMDPTDYHFHTFMEDPAYRASVAYQNAGYNQPTTTGFYFGADLGNMLSVERYSDKYVLDAGMEYAAYVWTIGGKKVGTGRRLEVPLNASQKEVKVTLQTLFRGYWFVEQAVLTL